VNVPVPPPAAPTVQNFEDDQNDYLSWVLPATGGSALVATFWESTDAKANSVAAPGTSVTVAQEGGTLQQYRIRVTNANGTSEWSPYSTENLTPPFFPPFFPFFPPFFPFFPFFPPSFPFFPSFSGSGSACVPSCPPGWICVGSGTCVN